MGANTTAETLALLKVAQSNPDDIIKTFAAPGSATTGLQAYNLEAPSLKLWPVLTPLRNSIARIGGGFATQANWKAITNINAGNTRAGIAEGKRGGTITHTLSEYFAAFRGYGLENSVTFEAQYAAKGFEDLKALATLQTLQATMIQEERLILGGNTSVASEPRQRRRWSDRALAGRWPLERGALSPSRCRCKRISMSSASITGPSGSPSPSHRQRCRDRLRAPMRTERPTHLAVARRRSLRRLLS